MWIWTWSSATCALLRQQRLVAGDPRLRARAAALGVGADPFELGGDRALASELGAIGLREALLLLLEPARVVAAVGDSPAAVELEDPAGDVVQEIAVVGDGDHGALVLGEMTLEPFHRLGVQVVRRLVEQQQVRLAEQQAAERHATALAARERRDRRVARRAAQRVHRVLDHAVEVPRVGGVDLLLQARELVRRLLGVVGRELVEALHERAQRPDAVEDVFADVARLVEDRLLLEHADAGAGRERGVAAELLVAARHDRQQRGFARPVVAEHADLGAVHEGQRDVLEHLAVGGMDLRQLVGLKDVLARHRTRSIRVARTRRTRCPGAAPPAEALRAPKTPQAFARVK